MFKQPTGRLILKLLSALLLLGVTGSSAETTPPVVSTAGATLMDCYQSARQISESVGISAENVKAVQALYKSEVGAVLPHIDWIKSQFYQDKASGSGSNNTGTSFLTTQPLSYFQLRQPLFAGMRDWETVKILKSQEQQARLSQRLTDLQLLSDVASAFYAAYTLQDQLDVLKQTRKLNQDQVDQLNHWVDIGRSRPSEVLSAQTQLASLDAQIEGTVRTIAEARHLLFFLTGIPADVPLVDASTPAPASSVEEALMKAGKRPELLSAEEALHQADLTIRFAQGGHLPTLGLVANSYTERVGILSDVRWDATFLLDVPLYEGGSTQALVHQARSLDIIARLTLNRLQRDIDRDVRTAYDDLSHAVSEVQAYDKAVQLATKNYDVQQKEYRLGIINNLELLQLLTNMQDVRRQWLVARANERLDDIHLRVAMGEGL